MGQKKEIAFIENKVKGGSNFGGKKKKEFSIEHIGFECPISQMELTGVLAQASQPGGREIRLEWIAGRI